MSPSPAASQGPCAKPNHEAQLVQAVFPKVFPIQLHDAIEDGAQPMVMVEVLLGPDGKVQQATINRSSGSAVLDSAAITAAKATTYTPKVVDCQPVAASYLLSLPFN